MRSLLRKVFGSRPQATALPPTRPRLRYEETPEVIYAIGDIHGRLDLLRGLEKLIAEDARDFDGDKLIVLLGDFVDRGRDSAGVLDHLALAPMEGFRRLCLAGNHEIMMLDALECRRPLARWLDFGGLETLLSYGLSVDELRRHSPSSPGFRHLVESYVPAEHLDFLRNLPVLLEFPELLLVHAGLRPGRSLDEQTDDDLTLASMDDVGGELVAGKSVVHGHRIVEAPLLDATGINVDTGAYLSGRLSAVRLVNGKARLIKGKGSVFLQATANAT